MMQLESGERKEKPWIDRHVSLVPRNHWDKAFKVT
jgi:hypothetical protein